MKFLRFFSRKVVFGALIAAFGPAVAAAGSVENVPPPSLRQLSVAWWQWAAAIPARNNPVLDPTGEDCAIGQRGDIWFLAGVLGSGRVTRHCTIPPGKALFFPIQNALGLDTPAACGQAKDDRMPISDLRVASADLVDGLSQVAVEVDGAALHKLHRIESEIFALELPADHLFSAACAASGGMPAGRYFPAVDDGLYARIAPLPPGAHVIRIRAKNRRTGFDVDVTYHLLVRSKHGEAAGCRRDAEQ